ncbi:MAG TPA: endonuclease III [Candidatus Ventricola gallistercoris]|nr:endonuclease III [Candidatus Ventricola gallistercoris]
MTQEQRYTAILEELSRLYPEAKPALHFQNPYQLLVAVILSAQCTDVKVNMVTPALFEAYPDAASLAAAKPEDVEPYIKTCGLYHNKAKNLVLTAQALCERYGGNVPEDHEALQTLPGVGRKTANVVMSCAFGMDAIAVDTHVFRVSNRLGLADAPDVLKTEKQLMENIPKAQWSRAHHWLIYHGRQVCTARKPGCDQCSLRPFCEYAAGNPKGKK